MSEAAAKAFITDPAGSTSAEDVRDAIGVIYDDLTGQTLIERQVAASTSAFDFTSIPATFETLRMVIQARSNNASDNEVLVVRFNNDSGTNYQIQYVQSSSTTVTGLRAAGQTSMGLGLASGANATANKLSTTEIVVPGYARTIFHKSCFSICSLWNGTAGLIQTQRVGDWASAAAISRVTIGLAAGAYVDGSVASLYGLA